MLFPLALLTACALVGEGEWRLLPIGGGDYVALAQPAKPAAQSPNISAPLAHQNWESLGNIPGVQEVHYMMSREACKALFNKLKREGESFTEFEFLRSGMSGSPKAGHCKLLGKSARDDRFIDRRYDNDY